MPLVPKPRTERTPHNKSQRAQEAEARGERTWTGWRLGELIDQVIAVNTRGLTGDELRVVRNLEYLKVKLLVPTATHHTGLRMPEPVKLKQDLYFAVDRKVATKLSCADVARWRENAPTPEELDSAVANLTGRTYSRQRRQ